MTAPLLSVEHLDLSIRSQPILSDVSLSVAAGEVLGIVGESGSGKSMTANAIMQLLPVGTAWSGAIGLSGEALEKKTEEQMCAVRGRSIGMIFQEPMTALNPVQTIGAQVAETIRIHTKASAAEALKIARETLNRVGLPEEQFPLDRYPHDLSGGQRQRVVIAMAIALRPKLLIADEPTTALDVTTQAQILKLLRRLVEEDGMGLILITHDLAVVADMADRIVIMKDGSIVEEGETVRLFRGMRHPYTQALFAASSHRPERAGRTAAPAAVLDVTDVVRDYALPRRSLFRKASRFRAVDHVSLGIRRGENVGLVGESGCGKSTLTRAILALDQLQDGRIAIEGKPFHSSDSRPDLTLRRKVQVVFQDPYSSFNPRHKVERLIAEPFYLDPQAPTGMERRRKIEALLDAVGLRPSDAGKYIHEFSGGQRQRIAIARALIIEPALIILDEAVSALDVSIRAQILDLLADLSDRLHVSYLFISHDLSVVRAITDRVLVMRAGRIVEEGPTEQVFSNPKHDYTKSLIAATPDLERALKARERAA
ncbi:MAG TPA: dipeptide ABC transporter ATP-binding protein [Pararhizobium sp.]|nr:dipeptide ABC transporter ATP-binding protein [Pararhizobium sp.]